ncbi:MAG: hypothetical protein H0T92_20200 [Pyrinomonadaceae bacterium]|nr:hypothetical protein [Pyrinomonadaceae bacterium]
MAQTKQKPDTSLRIPKPKKKLGLFVPPALRLPHDDLIIAEGVSKQISQASMPSHTSQARHINDLDGPIAPKRDYTKVANSITRHAVPDGMFTGKSKQLYDCLYAITRGAVTPSRTVRISRPKLMKKSGIGSRITIEANIARLINVGLIQVRQIAGEHDGNEYTVYLPEEVSNTMPSHASLTTTSSMTNYAQKVEGLVCLENSQTRHSSSSIDSIISSEAKTSFKTLDDESHTIEGFIQTIVEAARCVVGGNLPTSKEERERWKELGDFLAVELINAAKRTNTISSVPAFFAAHLRRQLMRKAEIQAKAEISSDTKTTGPQLTAKRTVNNSRSEQSTPKRKTGVKAKSKFSLEECMRYAEYLNKTGQGIKNPGGFAMTIYRTGEADELIATFLEPKITSEKTDHKGCPRCYGTGMEVVEGKGARRCTYNWQAEQETTTKKATTTSVE